MAAFQPAYTFEANNLGNLWIVDRMRSGIFHNMYFRVMEYELMPLQERGNPRSFFMCAEHVRQLGGESPLPSLMETKG
jgi:hypothetical protein